MQIRHFRVVTPIGDFDQRREGRTTVADGKVPAHCAQVGAKSERIGDHRDAGEPAFRDFGLPDQPNSLPARREEVEHLETPGRK